MKGASPATAQRAGAPQLPQLVPAELSVRVRDVQDASSQAIAVASRPSRIHHERHFSTSAFAADVRRDLALAPKQLQSKYLYDALGSSLFEAICRLPWYRITRARARLLTRTRQKIVAGARRGRAATIVELGCGSGEKLAVLAEALQAAGGVRARAPHRHFVAGARADRAAADAAAARVGRRPSVDLRGRSAPRRARARPATARCSCCCSDRTSATSMRRRRSTSCAASALALQPGDLLLLGADLVKPERDLQLAYDDPLGVTAAFNKNLLVRINQRARRDIRPRRVRSPRRLERRRAAHRDAPRQPRGAARERSSGRASSVAFVRGRAHLDREFVQVRARSDRAHGGRNCGFALRDQWIDADARFALSLLTGI